MCAPVATTDSLQHNLKGCCQAVPHTSMHRIHSIPSTQCIRSASCHTHSCTAFSMERYCLSQCPSLTNHMLSSRIGSVLLEIETHRVLLLVLQATPLGAKQATSKHSSQRRCHPAGFYAGSGGLQGSHSYVMSLWATTSPPGMALSDRVVQPQCPC